LIENLPNFVENRFIMFRGSYITTFLGKPQTNYIIYFVIIGAWHDDYYVYITGHKIKFGLVHHHVNRRNVVLISQSNQNLLIKVEKPLKTNELSFYWTLDLLTCEMPQKPKYYNYVE